MKTVPRKWSSAAACLLAVVSGGCSGVFEIVPEGNGTQIDLHLEGGLFGLRSRCVTDLRIEELGLADRDRDKAVWRIVAKQGCVRISTVRIGIVPTGFEQQSADLPLRTGRAYSVIADASGSWIGGGLPWFACSGSPRQIDWNKVSAGPPASCLQD